jgi:hypothetical protein
MKRRLMLIDARGSQSYAVHKETVVQGRCFRGVSKNGSVKTNRREKQKSTKVKNETLVESRFSFLTTKLIKYLWLIFIQTKDQKEFERENNF